MKKKNISIIILGLLVPFVLNAQIDITKRTVTCDSVNARNDSIYLNGPVSDNGKPLPKIDSTVYWSDTTGTNKTIATKHDLDTTYSAIGGNITLSQYQIAVGGADANSITGYSALTYRPSAVSDGGFNSGTTFPSYLTRMNYEGYLYATKYYSRYLEIGGTAGFSNSIIKVTGDARLLELVSNGDGDAIDINHDFDGSNNYITFNIDRTLNTIANATGAVFDIVDTESSTGNFTGRIFKFTTSNGDMISLNPYVNGLTAYDFITHNYLEGEFHTVIANKEDTLVTIDSTQFTVKKDFVHSPPFISLYRNTDTTLAAVVQNTWYKLSGLTQKYIQNLTLAKDSVHVEKIGNFTAKIIVSFSGNNGETWELGVFKNGVMELPDQSRYTSNNDTGNASCEVDFSCDGDDWISFKIRNITDTDVPTIKHIYIKIMTNYLE